MADLIYGIASWVYLGLHYATKSSAAVYRTGLRASEGYRDRRMRAIARENPSAYTEPTDAFTKYAFQPLKATSHIRVLILQPGEDGEMVRCSLKEMDLDSKPQYEALSYCWGESSDGRVILCQGLRMTVTENLYSALIRLRKIEGSRSLWVDAICINQEDTDERTQQVQLMGQIYRQCEQCLVWLGPHNDVDGLAYELLHRIQDFVQAERPTRDTTSLLPGKLRSKHATTPGQWIALSGLFARPWFERIWTLQEIVLPHRALMIWGKFSFDAGDFYIAVEFINQNQLESHLLGTAGGYLQSLRVAELRRQYHAHTTEMDLMDLLQDSRDRDATDVRDKVFGILGLCPGESAWASELGYRDTAEEIYIHVATYILNFSSNPARLLSACTFDSASSKGVKDLPSWVPDWTQRIGRESCIKDFEAMQAFRAGGSNLFRPTISTLANGFKALQVRGKILSFLHSFVERHSPKFEDEFKFKHRPDMSTCERIGDWYMYIALGWFFECLSDGDVDVTIERFFFRKCWELMRGRHDKAALLDTLACSITHPSEREHFMKYEPVAESYNGHDHQVQMRDRARSAFLHGLDSWTRVRKFCVTNNGQIGWVPILAEPSDVICAIEGVALPYVLRREPDGGSYTVIGHCYIYGIMQGESMTIDDIPLEHLVLT